MSRSKWKPWYSILQLIDVGFLVKKAQFFNIACILDHLKIPESQRVVLLGQFCLEKIFKIERIILNKPIYKCIYRKAILSIYPSLVFQRA